MFWRADTLVIVWGVGKETWLSLWEFTNSFLRDFHKFSLINQVNILFCIKYSYQLIIWQEALSTD